MHRTFSGSASWKALLASPPPSSHVVQIYDRHDFLASAVAHFAAEGLHRGEAVLLYGTLEHLRGIRERLSSDGIEVAAAMRSGQLSLNDVHEAIAAVAPHGSLDPALLEAVAEPALGEASSYGRFSGLRWWGEMSNVLYHHGDRESALRVEACGDALNRRYGGTLFCSFLSDGLEARAYEHGLRDMCATHSHLIPAEDYVRHRVAVNRAIADVVGEIRGPLLQSLWSWQGPQCHLPSSQALLFWLRETLPEKFEAVVAHARAYQTNECESHHRVPAH